jgi:peptide/nickel transport system substrate-binding protein
MSRGLAGRSKERVTRRQFLKGAGTGIAGATLLTLGSPLDREVATAQQFVPDATVTWGEDKDFRTLDPRVTQSRHEAQVLYNVFESLVFMDTDGKQYPWLAESWQFAKDGQSITFHLRRGVKFHDGTPFNAEAVKFTFDTIVDPKLGSQGAIDFLGPYRSTDIIDPYTAKVNWKRPFGPALSNLCNAWVLGIVSPTAVRQMGNDGFAHHPVGTGPFKFVEWVPRVNVVLERNDAYNWAPKAFKHNGPAYLKRLVFRIIPDDSTRVGALEKREIDVADAVPPIDVKRFKGSRDFDVMIGDVAGLPFAYFFNISKSTLNDTRVRQAFMYAVDRPKLIEQVFFGVAKPAYAPLAPTTPGYWSGAEKMYPYNPAKARQLLDEAGWRMGSGGVREKNGKALELYYPGVLEPELAVAIQAAVMDVGIKLKFENINFDQQDEKVLHNDYDIEELRFVSVDASILNNMFYSDKIPKPGHYGFNWSQIASPQLDRMLNEADAEVNPARRTKVVADIQKLLLERAWVHPLNISFQPIGFRRTVQNLKFAVGNWQLHYYDARVAR